LVRPYGNDITIIKGLSEVESKVALGLITPFHEGLILHIKLHLFLIFAPNFMIFGEYPYPSKIGIFSRMKSSPICEGIRTLE
jgi:hypothetical protein